MKKFPQFLMGLSLAGMIAPTTGFSFTGNQTAANVVIIPSLVNRFADPQSSFKGGSGQTLFVSPNAGIIVTPGNPNANPFRPDLNPRFGSPTFSQPNVFSVPSVQGTGQGFQGTGRGDLIFGLNPAPVQQGEMILPSTSFGAQNQGSFVTPNQNTVPNSAVPDPAVNAVPNPAINAVPNPAVNAVPAPPGTVFPGQNNSFPQTTPQQGNLPGTGGMQGSIGIGQGSSGIGGGGSSGIGAGNSTIGQGSSGIGPGNSTIGQGSSGIGGGSSTIGQGSSGIGAGSSGIGGGSVGGSGTGGGTGGGGAGGGGGR